MKRSTITVSYEIVVDHSDDDKPIFLPKHFKEIDTYDHSKSLGVSIVSVMCTECVVLDSEDWTEELQINEEDEYYAELNRGYAKDRM